MSNFFQNQDRTNTSENIQNENTSSFGRACLTAPAYACGAEENNTTSYVVKSGETIQALAKRFNVSVKQITQLNKVHKFKTKTNKEVDGFMQGQKISIPSNHSKHTNPVAEITPMAPQFDPDELKILQVSQQLYKAMHLCYFGTGFGTDEMGIYKALGRLDKNQMLIDSVKAKYSFLYSMDLETDLRSELSDSYFFGDQLSGALALININTSDSNDSEINTADKKGPKISDVRSQLKNKLAENEFSIVDDLLSKSQHKAQGAGSTNCNQVSLNMINTYLEAAGYDLNEYAIGSSLSTKDNSYHFVREKHESRTGNEGKKEVFKKLGVKDNGKKIRSYDHGLLEKDGEHNQALQYIQSYLKQDLPVLVGIDHTYSRNLDKETGKNSSYSKNSYNEGTTDHWIVIIGSGIDNGQKYFTYFDPGRGNSAGRTELQGDGSNTEWNRLYQSNKAGEDHIWRDVDGAMRGEYGYTLSVVARYNRDREGIKYQIQRELRRLGYYEGKIDGDAGGGTKQGIKDFISESKLDLKAEVSTELLEALKNKK